MVHWCIHSYIRRIQHFGWEFFNIAFKTSVMVAIEKILYYHIGIMRELVQRSRYITRLCKRHSCSALLMSVVEVWLDEDSLAINAMKIN